MEPEEPGEELDQLVEDVHGRPGTASVPGRTFNSFTSVHENV
ncbi:MAG: hypothetical protein QW351_09415 [Candidatus Caldarchaeum sp.]